MKVIISFILKVRIQHGITVIHRDEGYYQPCGAWKIQGTSASSEVHQYEGSEQFSRVIFSVTLNVSFTLLSIYSTNSLG